MHYRVDDFIEHAPMTVDPVEVIGVMANLENDAGWISEVVPNPDVSIVYEDDLQEPESQHATLDRLAPYLGIELPKIATKIYERVNAPTTKARLSKFAEVEAVLRSTRFARFLDSPELSAQPPDPDQLRYDRPPLGGCRQGWLALGCPCHERVVLESASGQCREHEIDWCQQIT